MSNTHGSKWIRPEKRLAIYIRDRFACLYCGKDLRRADKADITLDHLVARIHKGSNEADNLITACRRCNSQRSDTSWIDYATGGAIDRISTHRRLPLNIELAKDLIEGRADNPDVEVR